ncbi:hypothetical protein M378DRAFT_912018 [Amanita muscaria Koide BX008]|uniref:Uncharacterized protein n=1 Tax=Amanita muscaria (strain Koide BX008) TaxID=946122 RepID=A0A0C2T2C8_AMAMK|nr:hypothetical protein M378DRAFT_912018 [Amanita muscaria Koide BX008]
MNRKRSNVNLQNLRRSKRLKTPSSIQGSSLSTPQTPSTMNAVALWDPDGPEGVEPPTAPQDKRTVFPSTPLLTVHQTGASISSTYGLSSPQSNVHQVQSHEVFYGRPAGWPSRSTIKILRKKIFEDIIFNMVRAAQKFLLSPVPTSCLVMVMRSRNDHLNGATLKEIWKR